MAPNTHRPSGTGMCPSEEKKQDTMPGIAHKLARPNILDLHPYRCARDDYSNGILLDANENAIGPTSLPTNSIESNDNHNSLERYPDPYQIAVKQKFAQYRGHGLTPANIFIGVGSDEAIDLLMRIFCRPALDNILTTPPTYGMYKVCAKVNDVEVLNCPLTPDFDLQINEVRPSLFFLFRVVVRSRNILLTLSFFLFSDVGCHYTIHQTHFCVLARKPHEQGHSS
jgi:histidinol-phosphate aminotransferase